MGKARRWVSVCQVSPWLTPETLMSLGGPLPTSPLHSSSVLPPGQRHTSSLFLSALPEQTAGARTLLCSPLSPSKRQTKVAGSHLSAASPGVTHQGHFPHGWAWSLPPLMPFAWNWPVKVQAMGDPRSFSWQKGGSSAVTFILRRGPHLQPLAHSPELRRMTEFIRKP